MTRFFDEVIDIVKLKSDYLSPVYYDVLQSSELAYFTPAQSVSLEMSRTIFRNSDLLNYRLQRHSFTETLGSKTIKAQALKPQFGPLRDALLDHAKDEARHGRMFGALHQKIFGSKSRKYDFSKIEKANDEQVADENISVVGFMFDTHVAEVRTLAMLKNYETVIDELEDKKWKTAAKALIAKIQADENNHISYTGAYVSKIIDETPELAKKLTNSFLNYSKMGWADIADMSRFLAINLKPVSNQNEY